jgi:peptidyl-prolyl cis-trans isomerase C
MKRQTGIMRKLAGCTALVVLASGAAGQTPPSPSAVVPVTATVPAKPAAIVNGEAIPAGELDRVVEMLLKEKFKVQPATEAQRRQIRLEVLGLLINDALMRQFMQKHAPKVEPAAVDKELAALAAQLQKQDPPKTLQDFYRDTHQSEAQFRAVLASRLQWDAYVKAQVREADVKRYYEESKDFFDQVAVRASHIVIQVPASATDGERKAARDKLQAIRAEIIAGKLDFAEAAKKHSQCPSAPHGGDIGYFSRKGMLDENFARAAYALKAGDVSEIVTTDYGLHLIKVTDRKPGKPSDFEKIKDEVRDWYVQELAQQVLTNERKSAKIEMGQ